ncbi:hypothetical protein BOH66_14030 [Microbacterium aurum]|uniref:CopG family transcriptional regulator n=1 Tax=Microbacterium aurum TaxID=36805 RepID=A0A1P8UAV1_9MICO|nr:hypothetical protein [Microbacterium aurum]APZ35239.1 hypothetical protein BOH66_14030 [Microbacterium aurum]MBM7829223.1 hypothetical protein [Microbacterium aurum]
MGSSPLSIRFDDAVLERLRRRASARDATASGWAQRLVDEGLRQQEFVGIVFRDGPSGRRAGLMGGPDVWEVVSAVRGSDQRGDAAIVAAARDLDLSVARVQTAVAYYGAHAEEIDAEIVENEIAADEALRAWRAQQQLLS